MAQKTGGSFHPEMPPEIRDGSRKGRRAWIAEWKLRQPAVLVEGAVRAEDDLLPEPTRIPMDAMLPDKVTALFDNGVRVSVELPGESLRPAKDIPKTTPEEWEAVAGVPCGQWMWRELQYLEVLAPRLFERLEWPALRLMRRPRRVRVYGHLWVVLMPHASGDARRILVTTEEAYYRERFIVRRNVGAGLSIIAALLTYVIWLA